MLNFIQSMLRRLRGQNTPQDKGFHEKDSHRTGYFFTSSKASSSMEARLIMHAFIYPPGTMHTPALYAGSIKTD